jgi:transposase InsO family protein
MSLKQEFVLFAGQEGGNLSALCRQFGIDRKTGRKWLRRYREEGEAGLRERSRRPLSAPGRTADAVRNRLAAALAEHPHWGARKLKAFLEQEGTPMPAASTIHGILRHQKPPPEANTAKAVGRFEHDSANALWQMDFKGHFAIGGGRSHPLTLLDDHSRFLLCLSHCPREDRQSVQSRLIQAFERYGLPERMTMDNGAPWGGLEGTFTALALWLMKQGIRVGHSRPYHPQTQGKLERLHRSLKAELLQGRFFLSGEETQRAFDTWRDDYNLRRPHAALAMQAPASRYQPSARAYVPNPPPPDYADMPVRKGDSSGRLCFQGHTFRIGKAFRHETIGIREESEDGCYSLWWYSSRIGQIDLKNHSIKIGKEENTW